MAKGGYEHELVRRLISADPGNALKIGTDDKLFVGDPPDSKAPADDDATG